MPVVNLTTPPITAAMTGDEIRRVREHFKLSTNQMAEVLGFASHFDEVKGKQVFPGERRVRRWEAGQEKPHGSALAALKYLRAMDRALVLIEDGQWEGAANVLRDAMPEFMG